MSIAFKCTSCGKALRASPENAGKKIKCPGCAAVVPIPGGAAAPKPAAKPAAAPAKPAAKPAPAAASVTPPAAAPAGAIAACTACGAKVRTKPEWAGKSIKCPKCQTPIKVPAAAAPPPAPPKPAAKPKPVPPPIEEDDPFAEGGFAAGGFNDDSGDEARGRSNDGGMGGDGEEDSDEAPARPAGRSSAKSAPAPKKKGIGLLIPIMLLLLLIGAGAGAYVFLFMGQNPGPSKGIIANNKDKTSKVDPKDDEDPDEKKSKDKKPGKVTPVASAFEMIPSSAIAFVNVKAQPFLETEQGKQMLATIDKDASYNRLTEAFGVKMTDVVDVIMSRTKLDVPRDKSDNIHVPVPGRMIELGNFIAVTFAKPFNPAAFEADLGDLKFLKKEANKIPYYVPMENGRSGELVVVPSGDKAILIGQEATMVAYLSEPQAADGPLTPMLKAAASGTHVFFAGFVPPAGAVDAMLKKELGPGAAMAEPFSSAKSLQLSVSAKDTVNGVLTLVFEDADKAALAKATLDKHMAAAKDPVDMLKDLPGFGALAVKAYESVKPAVADAALSVPFEIPASLDELGAIIAAMAPQPKVEEKKVDPKKIEEKKVDGKDPLPELKSNAALSLVQTNAIGFVHVRSQAILKTDLGKKLAASPDMKDMAADLGVGAADLVEVVASTSQVPGPNPATMQEMIIVLAFSRPFKADAFGDVEKFMKREAGNASYFVGIPKVGEKVTVPTAIAVMGPSTLVLGPEQFVVKYLKKELPKDDAVMGQMKAMLDDAAKSDHVVFAAIVPPAGAGETILKGAPGEIKEFAEPFAVMKSLRLTLAADEKIKADVRVAFDDAGKAGNAKEVVDGLLGLGGLMIGKVAKSAPPGMEKLAEIGVASFRTITPAVNDKSLVVTAEAPVTLDDLVSLIAPVFEKVKGTAGRMQSANNLRQLALAMHNFHDARKEFPPTQFEKGQLSWRVAVLPYVEADKVYKMLKLDESWDSDHNKKLLDMMPPVFEHPTRKAPKGHTFYRVFVGPGTIFQNENSRRLTGITDGTSNTFLIVEGADAVPWTKSDELVFDPKEKVPALGDKDGFWAAFADGHVQFVSSKFPGEKLKAFITSTGGEIVDPNALEAFKSDEVAPPKKIEAKDNRTIPGLIPRPKLQPLPEPKVDPKEESKDEPKAEPKPVQQKLELDPNGGLKLPKKPEESQVRQPDAFRDLLGFQLSARRDNPIEIAPPPELVTDR